MEWLLLGVVIMVVVLNRRLVERDRRFDHDLAKDMLAMMSKTDLANDAGRVALWRQAYDVQDVVVVFRKGTVVHTRSAMGNTAMLALLKDARTVVANDMVNKPNVVGLA